MSVPVCLLCQGSIRKQRVFTETVFLVISDNKRHSSCKQSVDYCCVAGAVKHTEVAELLDMPQTTAATAELTNPVVDVLRSLVQQVSSSFSIIANESVPKVIVNDTVKIFFLNCNQPFGNFKP